MKSVMQHQFSKVPKADIQRSKFNRSHGLKTAFDAGYLVPVMVDEVLPGDTFNVKMHGFARMSTPLYPTMDNIFLDTFFFFVPNRLVWSNWEKFNGAQTDPGDSTSYLIPTVDSAATGFVDDSLYDYFGLPTETTSAALTVNNLVGRGYNLIFNEWFRDENLQDSKTVDIGDGPDTLANYVLLKRGKRHDYFTSCLPWPQKGTAVDLPLGTSAPIKVNSTTSNHSVGVLDGNDTSRIMYAWAADTPANALVLSGTTGADTDMFADLSSATAATINEIREAFQIQKLYERDARGGTRYTEIVRSHFGVTSPDARLQRPEYLGGGNSRINIHPVPQTSESGTTPQGSLAGFATGSIDGHGFTKSFTEHGHIIGLVNVRSDITYQQGINRMWSRQTRWDFYWPALAHIGEQEVYNKEIFAAGVAADDNIFGYQERYAEYRYKPSIVTSAFRSSHASSLDAWHLATDFAALPVLNDSFIQDAPPISRIVATPADPEFILDAYFEKICARPMPMYGVPGMLDHF